MSTQLDQIAPSHECNLGSPLREIRSAGSARGDGHKSVAQDPSLPTKMLRCNGPETGKTPHRRSTRR